MALSLRWGGCVAFLGLVLVGAHVLFPTWRSPREQVVPESPNWLWSYFQEFDREADLHQRLGFAQTRKLAQDQIGHELIAGRITLAEAARRFGELPDPPDKFREWVRLAFDGATDEECVGRLAIEWSCALLKEEPDRAAALRKRWQAELANLGAGRPPQPQGITWNLSEPVK